MIAAIFVGLFLSVCIYSLLLLKRKQMQLSLRVLIALLLSIVLGLFLKTVPSNQVTWVINEFLRLLGSVYLLLLKMLVIPLILTSILNTILNLGKDNLGQIKKISFLGCGILLILTSVASIIGIAVGFYFNIGSGLHLSENVIAPTHTVTGLTDTLLAMIPSNPIASMEKENTIAVMIFAVLIGFAARSVDKKDHLKIKIFNRFIAALFIIIKKLTHLILDLTPYGVLGLIALLIANQGYIALHAMINFIIAMYVAMIIMLLIHSFILAFFGYSPWRYFKNASLPLFVAFTTRSSFGTLPVTEETLRDKFKTKQSVCALVPSLGATIGMNACAGIYPAMLVVMTLVIQHQSLTWQLIGMTAFINAIASLGISGIPGTAYIAATVTLTSLGLPYSVVALVQGIDPIVDMGRTAVNVNGTLTTSLVVNRLLPNFASTETELELKQSEASANEVT